MSTLASLKKSFTDTSKVNKDFDKINEKESFSDARFWYPDVDKAGNGTSLIRFLPPSAIDGDDGAQFVQTFRHAFQGPSGDWYIENSLTTLGKSEKDPCGEFNSQLWRSAPKEERDDPDSKHPAIVQARKQKRKVEYVSNILVIEDELHPENDGKVFLFRYGQKIFDKIQAVMFPKAKGRKRIIPFDPWEGAALRINIKKVGGFRNYDDSEFEMPEPVGDDAKIEKLWNTSYSLLEFIKPTGKDPEGRPYYKSYEDLKARLDKVLEETTAPRKAEDTSVGERLKQKVNGTTTSPNTKAADESKFDDSNKTAPWQESGADEDSELDKYIKLARNAE